MEASETLPYTKIPIPMTDVGIDRVLSCDYITGAKFRDSYCYRFPKHQLLDSVYLCSGEGYIPRSRDYFAYIVWGLNIQTGHHGLSILAWHCPISA